MTRRVVTITPDAHLAAAHKCMRDEGVRHLPVVEDDALVGILSDRDVLARGTLGPGGLRGLKGTVQEAMTRDPVCARRLTPAADLAAQMIREKIDALPIVDESGRLEGLVTSTDLLQLLIDAEQPKHAPLPFEFQLLRIDLEGQLR